MDIIDFGGLWSWAICPKCGHKFLLTEENNPIMDRDELPPNILAALTEPVSSESHAQELQPSRPPTEHRKDDCTSSNQSDVLPPEPNKKVLDSHENTLGKEQLYEDNREG